MLLRIMGTSVVGFSLQRVVTTQVPPQEVLTQTGLGLTHYSSTIHTCSSSDANILLLVCYQCRQDQGWRSDAINALGCHKRDCIEDGISRTLVSPRFMGT